MNIEIGDTVSIAEYETKRTYTHYEDMADSFGMKRWEKGKIPLYNKKYIVRGIKRHFRQPHRIVVWIEDIKTKGGYLIDIEALVKDFISIKEFTI